MVWTLLLLDRGGILAVTTLYQQEGLMNNITTIGLDLAKRVFQVHGLDQDGQLVLRKQIRRGQVVKFFGMLPPCLIGMEACGSAHHWARELRVQGHDVRLIPPQYVRPFLKTNKHDAADAEAIAEAVVRPTMRFAPIKSTDQQAVLMLHRSRELLVKQRTMFLNAIRGHCHELGMIASQGASRVNDLIAIIEDPADRRFPAIAREALGVLIAQLQVVKEAIRKLEHKLHVWHRSQQASQRLTTIPGVGVITATALVATIGDGSQFKSGRHLSAWLGLVPRQHSSGGKSRLGRISKRGDGYLRRLLVHGSRAVLRWQRGAPKQPSSWIGELLVRRPTNVVLVAMANKTARTVWAMMRDQQAFKAVA
jgi:transposase